MVGTSLMAFIVLEIGRTKLRNKVCSLQIVYKSLESRIILIGLVAAIAKLKLLLIVVVRCNIFLPKVTV